MPDMEGGRSGVVCEARAWLSRCAPVGCCLLRGAAAAPAHGAVAAAAADGRGRPRRRRSPTCPTEMVHSIHDPRRSRRSSASSARIRHRRRRCCRCRGSRRRGPCKLPADQRGDARRVVLARRPPTTPNTAARSVGDGGLQRRSEAKRPEPRRSPRPARGCWPRSNRRCGTGVDGVQLDVEPYPTSDGFIELLEEVDGRC